MKNLSYERVLKFNIARIILVWTPNFLKICQSPCLATGTLCGVVEGGTGDISVSYFDTPWV